MSQKYFIKHNRDICIGCGACASVSEKYWKMSNKDGKADSIFGEKTENEEETKTKKLSKDYDENIEAQNCCPVNCIHIEK